jgi:vacuolar-type H+-ATPase subunit F/Vma7
VSLVVAIGEAHRLEGFALAGVEVRSAEDSPAVRDAWDRLGEVGVVILTSQAEAALAGMLSDREDVVWVSLPE